MRKMISQLEVNNGDELADMLEDPPIVNESAGTPMTPSTPNNAPTMVLTEKKTKKKRSCVLS